MLTLDIEAFKILLNAEKFHIRKNKIIKGISIDSRTLKKGNAFLAIKGKRDGHIYCSHAIKKGASVVIVEKVESSYPSLKVKNTLRALWSVARFHRKRFNFPVIGITGSCGKTTTKEILRLLFKEFNPLVSEKNYNNLLGVPLTILRATVSHRIGILEMGISKVGEMEMLSYIAEPNILLITSIFPSHLQYLHSEENIFKEKIKGIRKGTLILPYRVYLKYKAFIPPKLSVITFGEKGANLYIKNIENTKGKIKLHINNSIFFLHNTFNQASIWNFVGAIAVYSLFKPLTEINKNIILPCIKGRFEIKEIKGVQFIDDTYNSNPGSMKNAIRSVKMLKAQRKILCMGDMEELGKKAKDYHREIAHFIKEVFDIVVFYGEKVYWCYQEIKKMKNTKSCFFEDKQDVKKYIKKEIKKGDLLLFKGSRKWELEKILFEIMKWWRDKSATLS